MFWDDFMKYKSKLVKALLISILLLPTLANAQNDIQDIELTLSNFLDALSKGEKDRFESMFTEDNTVFSPFPWAIERSTVQESFAQLFEMLNSRPSGQSGAGLQPGNLDIDVFGNVAIITFHLNNNPNTLGRRTVIMIKEMGSWKVQHLHASSSQFTD